MYVGLLKDPIMIMVANNVNTDYFPSYQQYHNNPKRDAIYTIMDNFIYHDQCHSWILNKSFTEIQTICQKERERMGLHYHYSDNEPTTELEQPKEPYLLTVDRCNICKFFCCRECQQCLWCSTGFLTSLKDPWFKSLTDEVIYDLMNHIITSGCWIAWRKFLSVQIQLRVRSKYLLPFQEPPRVNIPFREYRDIYKQILLDLFGYEDRFKSLIQNHLDTKVLRTITICHEDNCLKQILNSIESRWGDKTNISARIKKHLQTTHHGIKNSIIGTYTDISLTKHLLYLINQSVYTKDTHMIPYHVNIFENQTISYWIEFWKQIDQRMSKPDLINIVGYNTVLPVSNTNVSQWVPVLQYISDTTTATPQLDRLLLPHQILPMLHYDKVLVLSATSTIYPLIRDTLWFDYQKPYIARKYQQLPKYRNIRLTDTRLAITTTHPLPNLSTHPSNMIYQIAKPIIPFVAAHNGDLLSFYYTSMIGRKQYIEDILAKRTRIKHQLLTNYNTGTVTVTNIQEFKKQHARYLTGPQIHQYPFIQANMIVNDNLRNSRHTITPIQTIGTNSLDLAYLQGYRYVPILDNTIQLPTVLLNMIPKCNLNPTADAYNLAVPLINILTYVSDISYDRIHAYNWKQYIITCKILDMICNQIYQTKLRDNTQTYVPNVTNIKAKCMEQIQLYGGLGIRTTKELYTTRIRYIKRFPRMFLQISLYRLYYVESGIVIIQQLIKESFNQYTPQFGSLWLTLHSNTLSNYITLIETTLRTRTTEDVLTIPKTAPLWFVQNPTYGVHDPLFKKLYLQHFDSEEAEYRRFMTVFTQDCSLMFLSDHEHCLLMSLHMTVVYWKYKSLHLLNILQHISQLSLEYGMHETRLLQLNLPTPVPEPTMQKHEERYYKSPHYNLPTYRDMNCSTASQFYLSLSKESIDGITNDIRTTSQHIETLTKYYHQELDNWIIPESTVVTGGSDLDMENELLHSRYYKQNNYPTGKICLPDIKQKPYNILERSKIPFTQFMRFVNDMETVDDLMKVIDTDNIIDVPVKEPIQVFQDVIQFVDTHHPIPGKRFLTHSVIHTENHSETTQTNHIANRPVTYTDYHYKKFYLQPEELPQICKPVFV